MNKNIFKSIGVLFAGFISIAVLSVGTDFLLFKLNVYPPQTDPASYLWWMLLGALIYRTAYGLVGGYLAASLSPSCPMRHAVILGTVGLVFGTISTIANWHKAIPSTEWYPVSLLILTLPSILLGGKLGSKRNTKTEQQPAG